eukprot:TRINITY_DN29390_c0_g8_i1.p1 TRINITY_DN29390_c0_g8~~TRINITY_DN29390_c0_g8_i1.p1  ORF type:complete len:253 (+),score=-9.12 TRINITY_DN29390_c0_g8_i1:360-1118(+)
MLIRMNMTYHQNPCQNPQQMQHICMQKTFYTFFTHFLRVKNVHMLNIQLQVISKNCANNEYRNMEFCQNNDRIFPNTPRFWEVITVNAQYHSNFVNATILWPKYRVLPNPFLLTHPQIDHLLKQYQFYSQKNYLKTFLVQDQCQQYISIFQRVQKSQTSRYVEQHLNLEKRQTITISSLTMAKNAFKLLHKILATPQNRLLKIQNPFRSKFINLSFENNQKSQLICPKLVVVKSPEAFQPHTQKNSNLPKNF